MKKILFLFVAMLLVANGFAQKAPTTKLLSSTENEVVVNVQLNGYSMTKVQTPQGEQFIVNVPQMAAMLEAGTPNLPTLPIPVLIGDLAQMSVNVIDAQYTDYPNMDIAPSKGNISRQINPDDVPYTYGAMYQQDAFWPAQQAYLEAPYIIRDYRGQNIMVRPFAYNPQTHTLRVYDNLTIAMTKVSDNGENPMPSRKSNVIKMDPETKQAYNRRFINYSQASTRYPFLTDNGEMLVICADQFMEGMEEFVTWKNESGRPTTMVSVTEAGGNNDNSIKNYIQNFYNDPNHNLTYVLFVGDYEHITPHQLGSERSDGWFGQLTGNDHYPEVFIGRFSVQSDNHVANHVNKVLYYERDMQADITWGNQGLGIGYIGAGSGHYGEDDYQHIDFIRDTLMHYTYTQVTELHGGGGGASTTSISNTINSGVGIINYCNHGSEYSWGVADYSTSNVNALVNDNKLPIIWSVACLNGKFNYTPECFAEAWMRATDNSTGVPTGAIGGMFSWMSQPWIPPMYGQDEMVAIVTEWRNTDQFNHTLAGASLNGNMNVIDMSGSGGYNTHDTWVLFGDPSLLVRTDNPTDMNVTVSPSTLMLGMTELVVNADADFGIATLTMDGEVLASANIVDGVATLSIPGLNQVGMATLTVIGYNKVTYRGEVEIIPAEGPYLVLDNYSIETENDAVVYGEDATANLTFKNVGVENAQNITVTVSTDNEYIKEIYNPTAVIEEVAAGASFTLPEGIRFAVANNTPDQTVAEFYVEMTAGDQVWNGKFQTTVNAPVLAVQSINTTTGIHAGETGTLSMVFVNNGHFTSPAGTLNVISSSDNIVFAETAISFDAIGAGETVSFEINYTISSEAEEGSCYDVVYVLNADHYTFSGSTAVTVGTVADTFETGDFATFPWTFEGTPNWTIVNTGAYEGTYCAKSGAISHSQSTSLVLTVDIPTSGNMSFFKKVSSEGNYDKLTFYIDNNKMGEWSGTIDWSQETYAIAQGSHTFKWTYAKDVSVSSGSDCAWIDNVVLPASSIVGTLPPVQELEAAVEGNTVTLTWVALDRAVSYTIYRNGEVVATQEEATFSEEVEHGTYTYSIVYRSEDGILSSPTYVTVDVTSFLGVAENMHRFVIYPNPTEGNLYIRFNGAYSYTLYNSFGQKVMDGNANGNEQLSLSNLAKGFYLLHLNNGQQTEIQKVIVK